MKTPIRYVGPYRHKTGKLAGRQYMQVYYDDGSKGTTLYSRYLMERHLGRYLDKSDHVDHINGDHTDDRLENLQVLTISDHARKSYRDSGRSIEYIEFDCPECGTTAKKEARNIRHNRNMGKKGPYCSRSCAARATYNKPSTKVKFSTEIEFVDELP